MNPNVPPVPKAPDGPLMVLLIGRPTAEHHARRGILDPLARAYPGAIQIKALGCRGGGTRADRESLVEAAEEIATGAWDLVLAPDLAQICRNPRHLHAFVRDAVDRGTRVVAPGDDFDTAGPAWPLALCLAAIGLEPPAAARRRRRPGRPIVRP